MNIITTDDKKQQNINQQNVNYKTQYQQYIIGLEQPLYDLAKEETDLRLQHLIEITNDSIDSLHRIISLQSINRYKYNINGNIYNNFLLVAANVIKKKCEKGINFTRFKKEINKKNIWNTLKGYWFHNVPNIISEFLWIPLLKDIYEFYNSVANNICKNNGNISKLNGLQMQQYLRKTFIKELLEAKCQINQNSNPSGQLIQCACWKNESFQQCINTYFDENNSYLFTQWVNTKKNGSNTKNMSIQQIVTKYIKKHAQLQHQIFINSIGINKNTNKINKIVNETINTANTITNNIQNQNGIYLNSNQCNTNIHNQSIKNTTYNQYNTYNNQMYNNNNYNNQPIQYNNNNNNNKNQPIEYNQLQYNEYNQQNINNNNINNYSQYNQYNQYNSYSYTYCQKCCHCPCTNNPTNE